ncbi:Aste57867_24991 [Aphanomyces stellatus]|uniref:Aste57867_24991 protein n=1 Tax=Aphanomyces stellatus TaxID=120398 RepID=A0A485LRY1_9STRA|nr:hypothetical protein As57867_024913 [Aphanomyces stellatus]VFU01622.1 Aste57867_24991 [Aphanomyces stellatus]
MTAILSLAQMVSMVVLHHQHVRSNHATGDLGSSCLGLNDCNHGLTCYMYLDAAKGICKPNPMAKGGAQCGSEGWQADLACEEGYTCHHTASLDSIAYCAPIGHVGVAGDGCRDDSDCNAGLTCQSESGVERFCRPINAMSKGRGASCRGIPDCQAGLTCSFDAPGEFGTCQQGTTPSLTCTRVSVQGDATYCISGAAVCGSSHGDRCPAKGQIAIQDCVASAKSYVDVGKCVAREDAWCMTLKSGARGCVWASECSHS